MFQITKDDYKIVISEVLLQWIQKHRLKMKWNCFKCIDNVIIVKINTIKSLIDISQCFKYTKVILLIFHWYSYTVRDKHR